MRREKRVNAQPHNPVLLFRQSMDRRNGAQKHFWSSPPCKAKQTLPLNFSSHFLSSPPCCKVLGFTLTTSRAQQLHMWKNSSCTMPENSTCSRQLEWDYWRKNRILAQWKIRWIRWFLAHFSFSLYACPAPLPHTLRAGWRSLSYRNSWRNIISMTKSKIGSSCMWPESPTMSAGRHWG